MIPDNSIEADVATVLFTEIEGLTRWWEQESSRMPSALSKHDALATKAVEGNRGTVVKLMGGGVLAAFDDALDAVNGALQLQLALAEPEAVGGLALRARCGLHSGVVERRDGDFFGTALNRAARIMGQAHGGQILLSRSASALLGDRLPAGVELRDMGLVRLRGVDAPERLFQVVHPALRQDFPALGGLEASPNNLPEQATPLIGRERERREIARLLESGRLVTVLGATGMGKTRVALQVAAEAAERFRDGVWLVELAAASDAHEVAPALAQVLHVGAEPGAALDQALAAYAAPRTMLLLFDRCGHLVEACARLADTLLRAAPGLRIIVTSREPLRVTGEQAYHLQPLSLPDPTERLSVESIASAEAVALFVDRARRQRPDFALTDANAPAVADICTRLDGIPLAIELAAQGMATMSVEAIDARLRARMSSLAFEEPIAWPELEALRPLLDRSYDRLSVTERTLLNRMAVFMGGCDLDAAEQVCGAAPLEPEDVVDAVTTLIDRSLVVVGDDDGRTRYRVYEIMREYVRERIHEDPDALADLAATSARHAEYFAALAGEAHERSDLAAERGNIAAALAFVRKRGGTPDSVRPA